MSEWYWWFQDHPKTQPLIYFWCVATGHCAVWKIQYISLPIFCGSDYVPPNYQSFGAI